MFETSFIESSQEAWMYKPYFSLDQSAAYNFSAHSGWRRGVWGHSADGVPESNR